MESIRDILDSISAGVVVYKMPSQREVIPVYRNRRLCQMLKIKQNQINDDALLSGKIDSPECELSMAQIHPEDKKRVFEEFSIGYYKKSFKISNFRMLRSDGIYIYLDADIILRQATSEYKIFYATFINVSEEQRLQRELQNANETERILKYQAQRDLATGLFNKVTTESLIKEHLKDGNAFGSLYIIDIDDLKSINDRLGHMEGDLAIRQVAMELVSGCRSTDIIGRVGGDEFMVFLPGVIKKESLCKQAERIINSFCNLRIGENAEHQVKCSIGIAIGHEGITFDEIYALADKALYKTKKFGKNGITILPED